MKQKGKKKLQKIALLGFEPRALGTITTILSVQLYVYIEYFVLLYEYNE